MNFEKTNKTLPVGKLGLKESLRADPLSEAISELKPDSDESIKSLGFLDNKELTKIKTRSNRLLKEKYGTVDEEFAQVIPNTPKYTIKSRYYECQYDGERTKAPHRGPCKYFFWVTKSHVYKRLLKEFK